MDKTVYFCDKMVIQFRISSRTLEGGAGTSTSIRKRLFTSYVLRNKIATIIRIEVRRHRLTHRWNPKTGCYQPHIWCNKHWICQTNAIIMQWSCCVFSNEFLVRPVQAVLLVLIRLKLVYRDSRSISCVWYLLFRILVGLTKKTRTDSKSTCCLCLLHFYSFKCPCLFLTNCWRRVRAWGI